MTGLWNDVKCGTRNRLSVGFTVPEGDGVIVLCGKDERWGADLMDVTFYGIYGIFRA